MSRPFDDILKLRERQNNLHTVVVPARFRGQFALPPKSMLPYVEQTLCGYTFDGITVVFSDAVGDVIAEAPQ